ncbi:hypothetical protein E2C01_042797 [Portunus trituberculatus]|uniref:Uncharacterized protein n=1 Tax=Portunus trituberculatus TaxID=210409 RepID=A0A5B7FMQ6_PORTR|nr:hypothetical protein [Portunus trituberculatus]
MTFSWWRRRRRGRASTTTTTTTTTAAAGLRSRGHDERHMAGRACDLTRAAVPSHTPDGPYLRLTCPLARLQTPVHSTTTTTTTTMTSLLSTCVTPSCPSFTFPTTISPVCHLYAACDPYHLRHPILPTLPMQCHLPTPPFLQCLSQPSTPDTQEEGGGLSEE